MTNKGSFHKKEGNHFSYVLTLSNAVLSVCLLVGYLSHCYGRLEPILGSIGLYGKFRDTSYPYCISLDFLGRTHDACGLLLK